MRKWIPLAGLFAAVAAGLFVYLYSFTVTDASNLWLDVTPWHAAGWEITGLQNGGEVPLTAEQAIKSRGTVVLRRAVTEQWLEYESIKVSGRRAMCVWVDDDLVFSNCSARPDAVSELSNLKLPEGQPFDVTFSLNTSWVGKTITVASAIFVEPMGSIGFTLVSEEVIAAQTSAWVSAKTLPGVAFGVLFLLLFGLFLFRAAMGKGALPLLYLAAAALVQMLCYLDGLESNPLLFDYLSAARVVSLLLPLLYLASKMLRVRRAFLGLSILLWAVYFLSVLAWSAFYLPVPLWFDKLAYLSLALFFWLLVCSVQEYRAGNAYFGRLLALLGSALVGYGALFVVSALFNKQLFDWLLIYWREALAGYPMPMAFGIFTVLLAGLFLLAIWDLVESSVEAARQIEALKLRGELTAQSLASVQQVNEALATVRHDELHHLRALAALYQQDPAHATEYAVSLAKELERIPSMRFTQNRFINAILSVQAGIAAAAGIKFEAKAKLPPIMAIPETELSTVLMNLLQNAVEAAARAPARAERKVTVLLEIEDETLLVAISNTQPESFDPEALHRQAFFTTKADAAGHGYGIRSARAVVSRRGGELRYVIQGDMVTVNTAMELCPP